MNYIRHLNAFFSFVRSDNRLTSSHVSLYMALFQYWNFNRFQNPFPVYRDNIMKQSKVGSKNTYHKCIKELHEAKYIYYQPSVSKFLPVRISLIRLDIEEEQPTRYKQLDLFNKENGTSPCPNNGTDSVPNLTAISTDFDTGTVSKMGHNIKLNLKENKTVSNTPTKIFNKNEKLSKEIKNLGAVPNLGHTLGEVETFFAQSNYPIAEAKKFFYYNQGRGWMLRDKVPIKDWQSLGHKWMLGIGKKNTEEKQSTETGPDAEELFKRFSQGQKIFNLITADHFQQLQLSLNETMMQEAWQERINQLTGSNQNSILQLLQSYLDNRENDPQLIKDEGNLVILAKRIAVLKHFSQLRLRI